MPIKLIVGDITKLKVDAIVNSANPSLLGGGGVDGAIHQAAGPELLEYTKTLGGAKVTEAKITQGFKLHAKYIIHAVGPIYIDGKHDEEAELYKTYFNALSLAKENYIKSIAFPLISAGVYKFPKQLAINIAYQAMQDFLDSFDMDISLVFYSKDIFNHLEDLQYNDLVNFINKNFFDETFEELSYLRLIDENVTRKHANVIYNKDVAPTLRKTEDSFADQLNKIMLKKGIYSNELWKKANIDRKLFSKIFNGSHPSKKTAILLTLALELNIDESLDLLSRAGYTLSNAIKEDLVVRWHIENKIYSVMEVCESQLRLGLNTLF